MRDVHVSVPRTYLCRGADEESTRIRRSPASSATIRPSIRPIRRRRVARCRPRTAKRRSTATIPRPVASRAQCALPCVQAEVQALHGGFEYVSFKDSAPELSRRNAGLAERAATCRNGEALVFSPLHRVNHAETYVTGGVPTAVRSAPMRRPPPGERAAAQRHVACAAGLRPRVRRCFTTSGEMRGIAIIGARCMTCRTRSPRSTSLFDEHGAINVSS